MWRKIISNVLNIPLEIPAAEEGPGYGGAMLSMVGCGEYKTVNECAHALVETKEVIMPDKDIASRYEMQYNKFRRIYPSVKELFKTLK